MCAERETRRRGREAGLTLSELMIAMGLTSVVAVMLLASAQVQTGLSRQASQMQYAQDNVRAAMEEIVQNVRRAGKSFNTMSAVNAVSPFNPQRLMAVTVVNAAMGANTPDRLDLMLVEDGDTATLMEDASQFTNPLRVNKALANMTDRSLFVLSDFKSAVLYSLVGTPGAATLNGINVVTLAVTPPPVTPAPMFKGSIVNTVKLLSYRIDTTVFPGMPVLVLQEGVPLDMSQQPQVVAENVEDLQLAVGVDGLFSGVRDGRISETGKATNDDEWVYNFPGEAMPMVLPGNAVMLALRITVVGRTASAGEQLAPGRPAAEDRPAGGQDYLRRRTLTTQIGLRNIATP